MTPEEKILQMQNVLPQRSYAISTLQIGYQSPRAALDLAGADNCESKPLVSTLGGWPPAHLSKSICCHHLAGAVLTHS